MENKYQKGKIYKIVDVGYNKCYIGSTIESLSNRMSKHRNHYKNFQYENENKLYYIVFDLFDEYGVENCKIELIEKYPCCSTEELHSREGHYIQNIDCINKRVAGRTKKQYIVEKKRRNCYKEQNKRTVWLRFSI